MKRTAGYTENQDSQPQANQQHAVYYFSKVHRNIECTITGARRYSPQGELEVPQPCILSQLFMVMQKLERPYKLSTGKNINQY